MGGHLVRTKNDKSDEGGVAVGASVISSLYVIWKKIVILNIA